MRLGNLKGGYYLESDNKKVRVEFYTLPKIIKELKKVIKEDNYAKTKFV